MTQRTWRLVDEAGRTVMTATSPGNVTLISVDEAESSATAKRVLADLDRCVHGRHYSDACNGCDGGRSAGNPFLHPNKRIGTTMGGKPIILPKEGLWDPANFLP